MMISTFMTVCASVCAAINAAKTFASRNIRTMRITFAAFWKEPVRLTLTWVSRYMTSNCERTGSKLILPYSYCELMELNVMKYCVGWAACMTSCSAETTILTPISKYQHCLFMTRTRPRKLVGDFSDGFFRRQNPKKRNFLSLV